MRSMVFTVFILGGVAPLILAQDAAVQVIEAEEGAANWVVQESTGRIFASVKTSDLVVEYGPDGSKLREFKVGGEPDEMLIKATRLVVGCRKSTTIHVIDLTKNQVLGSVSLEGKGPYALFGSRAANPYVYGICNTGDAWWDGEVYQIDLREMNVRKRVKVQQWSQSHPTHMVMSADGKWIVPDARGASSPSGADLMQVDEEAFTFRQIRDHHDSFGQKLAGPNNRFWTFGNLLFPLDITASIRKFSGSPVAIHPYWNLAVSHGGATLFFESFDGANLLKRVSLPPASPPVSDSSSRSRSSRSSALRSADPTLQFDLKNHRVFLGIGKRGYSVNLKGLGIDYQPLLLISAPSSASVKLGTTLRVPLDVTNPSLSDSTTFRVLSGPDGVNIEKNELVWKPKSSQIGPQEIAIEAVSGTLKDSLKLQVSVETPKLELEFTIAGTAVDSAGKYLAVWGPKISKVPDRPPSTGTPVEFAMVDWENQKLLVQRNLTSGLRAAIVDDKYLYLSPSSGNLVYRLNREDLGDGKRLFLNAPVSSLFKLNSDTLAVIGTLNHRTTCTTYDRETLKKLPSAPDMSRMSHMSSRSRPGFISLSKSHRQVEQRVVDAKTGEFLYATSSYQLPSLAPTSARLPSHGLSSMTSSAPMQKVWGRRLAHNSLTNHVGSRIANWNSSASQFSLEYPIVVSIRSASEARLMRTYLELRDLVQGEVIYSGVIDVRQSQSSSSSYYSHSQPDRLRVSGDRVVYADRNQLLFAELPADAVAKAKPPVHFRLPGKSVYGTDKPVKLKLGVDGGSGSLSFGLAFEYPGLDLNEKSGEVTLDVPTMWKTFASNFPTKMRDFRAGQTLRKQLEDNGKHYQSLSGQPLPQGKLALTLPISVSVADAEGQEDRLTFFAIVLADRTVIDKANAEYAKKQAETQEKMRLAAEERRQQQIAEQKAREEAAADAATAEGGRVEQLEQRVRRLEAAIDAILLKLDKLQNKE